MRYIFLIYSRETDPASISAEEDQAIRSQHRAVQDEAARKGVLQAAQPLQRTAAGVQRVFQRAPNSCATCWRRERLTCSLVPSGSTTINSPSSRRSSR